MKEVELIEKRKLNEKHFLQEDGTIIAKVYGDDVHYLKGNKYLDIDNTLRETDDYYENKENSFIVKFNKTNNHITIDYDKNTLSMIVNNNRRSNKQIKKQKETIIYDEVLDKTDISYALISKTLKESIILKSQEAVNEEISFRVTTKLNLVLEKDGSISAYKGKDKIYTINSPYMIDDNYIVNTDVRYNITKSNGNENEKGNDFDYEISLSLDKKWLDEKDRAYPVIIDPTISVASDGIRDTFIHDGDDNINNNGPMLKIGVDDDNIKKYRTLIKFGLPTLGSASRVINATATLTGYIDTTPTTRPDEYIISVHEVTEDWDEVTAKWATMHDKFNPRIEDNSKGKRSITAVYNKSDFNITNLVKKWQSGTNNYGIMLKAHDETNRLTNGKVAQFYSKDNASTFPVPVLILTYRDTNGIEDYMTYQTRNYSHGQSSINNLTGNLTTVFDINSTVGAKLPAGISLIYNTHDVIKTGYDYGLVPGNKFNYYKTIKELTINNKLVLEYLDEDGTIHYFRKSTEEGEENTFKDEDGLNLTITKQNNNYIMKDNNSYQYLFELKSSNQWYLTEIKDTDSNAIKIFHNNNNQIVKVTDSSNKEINIVYNSSNYTITSPAHTNIINISNNKIVSLEVAGDITSFNYNNNGLLEKIIDSTEISTEFKYYNANPYKVEKVTEYGLNNEEGTSLAFNYGFDTTTVTDNKNRKSTFTFNVNGATVSTTSLEQSQDIETAYGASDIFGLYESATNKLVVNNSLFRPVINYIPNPSFESYIIGGFIFGNNNALLSEDYANTGKRSLKLSNPNESVQQILPVPNPEDKHYTFSSYIKSTGKVTISMKYEKEDTTKVIISEEFDGSSEFKRAAITTHILEDANIVNNQLDIEITISVENGQVAYIDDIQLEEGELPNLFNIIDNSNFWFGSYEWNVNQPGFHEIVYFPNGNAAMRTNSDVTEKLAIDRSFNLNGKKGDTYNLSFWYKNEGIESTYKSDWDYQPEFNAYVVFGFQHTDTIGGTYPDNIVMPLNPNNTEWQFISVNITAELDYYGAGIEIISAWDANYLYVTNFTLFKELGHSEYTYNENGSVISIKNSNQSTMEFIYDNNDQIIKTKNSRAPNQQFEYDNKVVDRVLSILSSNGITTKYRYDEFGNSVSTRIINTKDPNGLYRVRVRGTNNYLTGNFTNKNISDLNNTCSLHSWKLIVDGNNCIIKSNLNHNYYINLSGNTVLLGRTSTPFFEIIYNDNGSVSFKQIGTENYLNIQNNTLVLSDKKGEFFLESINNELFIENTCEYTEDGRFLKSMTDALNNKTAYDVDSVNGLTNSETNPNGVTKKFTYDNKERLIKVKQADGEVKYEYNNQNLLSKVILGTNEYDFTYDNFLNPKTASINNVLLEENIYEEKNGNLKKVEYGNNNSISYKYDNFDRILTLNKMDRIYKLSFDNLSRIGKITDGDNTYFYNYDFAGRLSSIKNNDYKIDYEYDKASNLSKRVDSLIGNNELVAEYFYDVFNNIEKALFNNSGRIDYNYDYLKRLNEKIINNSYKIHYNYLSHGKKTSTLVETIVLPDNTIQYKYDELNNITHVYINKDLITQYYYDDNNQLIKEENHKTNELMEYSYDNTGNILSKKYYNLISSDLIKEDEYEYNNSAWADQLTKFNNEIITYDEIGNPLSVGNSVSMSWINGKELKTYADTNKALNVNYKYNEYGIRYEKIVNGTKTQYCLEDTKIIFEKRGTDVLQYLYDTDGIAGLKYNNNLYYFIKNVQGDITCIIDNLGIVVANYEYDSWGNSISITDGNGNDVSNNASHIANVNSFRYRSYYLDAETSLYYLNSRYYNPKIGRFINADDTDVMHFAKDESHDEILSVNLYAYCKNNPVNYEDPTGYWFSKIKKAIQRAKDILQGTWKLVRGLLSIISIGQAGLIAAGLNSMTAKALILLAKTTLASTTAQQWWFVLVAVAGLVGMVLKVKNALFIRKDILDGIEQIKRGLK